jgi:scyllo-inositol 2-dehydrogenase (NADP+)
MNHDSGSIVPVGIAGLGRAGWHIHADTLAQMTDKYSIVAACDPDTGRQQEARDRFGCRTYSEFADVLGDDEVELVVVAVPSHLHADYSIEAMNAGKHVLVEKPMADSVSDVDRMIAASRETGRILTVNQNYRNMPDFLKVREVIESGKLGRIILVRIAWHDFSRRWDWQTLKEFGGGQLNNAGAHAIDRALLLLGDDVEPEVLCHMEQTPLYSGDAESHVKIILQTDNGPMIDIELTNACAYPQEEWLVMGTQGGLSGTSPRLCWKYFDPELVPPRPVSREPTPDRSYNREELPWREETCDVSAEHNPGYRKVYLDLYATLRRGEPLAITPESVRRQIAVLDRCRELSPV